MRQQKQGGEQGRNSSGWRHLKEALGLLGGLLAFLGIILGIVVLPGLVTNSASTVAPRAVRAARR